MTQTPGALESAVEALGSLRLGEVDTPALLRQVSELAVAAIPGASDASVTVVTPGRGVRTAAASSTRGLELDERQYAIGNGPCLDSADAGEVSHLVDTQDEPRWPLTAAAFEAAGIRSTLSTPLPLHAHLLGALNIYAPEPGAFDAGAQATARTLAGYAGAALANLTQYQRAQELAEETSRGLVGRAAVEQARGILVARHGGDLQSAFDRLATEAQATGRRLQEVAEDVVASVKDTAASGRVPR